MGTETHDDPFQRVAPEGSIEPGTCRDFAVVGGHVLVCNVDGALYAVADICTHDGAPLGDAQLFDCNVECPRHGATFDVRSGKATALPAVRPIATYPVRVTGGYIEVQFQAPKKARPTSSRPSPFRGLNQ